jgi:hypothetical protein
MAELKFTEKSEQVVAQALELAAQNACPQGEPRRERSEDSSLRAAKNTVLREERAFFSLLSSLRERARALRF